ncbi:MAG: hypothetical protein ACLFS9_06205 [Nitriliruptoraceae bacterium]
MDPQQARARADAVMERHEAGELEGALAEVRALLADLELVDVTDEVLRESLFTARFEHAVLLTELGDLQAAADAYGVAARTPSDLDDPDQRHELALAALNQGICLDALGERDAAVTVYAGLVARFGDADDPVTVDQVVRARVNHAAALLAAQRPSEAAAVAREIRTSLAPDDVLSSEQHVMAARIEAAALCALGRDAEAVAVLTDLDGVTREDEATWLQLIAAAQEACEVLLEQDRRAEAAALLDQVLDADEPDPSPEVTAALEELTALRARLGAD